MNKIDIENINKEIEKRKAAKYKWTSGGDLTREAIEDATDKQLNEYLKKYKSQTKEINTEEIKKLVDEAFAKFSTDPEDNMIVLGACDYSDDSRHAWEVDNAFEYINFDGFNHDYNKLAYPIGRYFDFSYYDHEGTEDDKLEEFNTIIVNKIKDYLVEMGMQPVEEYWQENNEPINECWYGVHAITKDYKVVVFVIRDDGMLCDEESFNTFCNSILYEL